LVTIYIFLKLNLTSYSTTLRVINSGGGLGLNEFEEYVDWRKFSVFLMVSDLLERAEERTEGTKKDFLKFWRVGDKKK